MKNIHIKKFLLSCVLAGSMLIPSVPTNAASLSLRYNGKNVTYTGKQLSFSYHGKKVSLTGTPGIQLNNTNMLPYYKTLVTAGPKVKRSYNSKTGKLVLTNGSKKVTFYKGKKYAYTNGTKRTLTVAPLTVKYRKVNKTYLLVPAKFAIQYLGFTYKYSSGAVSIPSPTPAPSSALLNYVKLQQAETPSYAGKKITNYADYIDPSKDTTNKYQFLRIDSYHGVKSSTYASTLSTMISGKSKSVLKGKATVFTSAAQKYKIDPLYFLCQTVHESAYGTSTLASGNSITTVVSGKSVVKNSKDVVTGFKKVNGKYITEPISKTTVYNLYGIKAYDDAAQLCGFSYAYYMKWTSVDKAINGAAQYVSENYIHNSTYNQNTIYRFRYITDTNYIWHEYATDPAYARGIGTLMYKYRSVYSSPSTLTYTVPSYK
ncbi:MAG: glucosaminidase domain-containing protein [Anaerostipes sp.]|nr:glucosaminidase domain-containing protein [Anaerostipes sp.]